MALNTEVILIEDSRADSELTIRALKNSGLPEENIIHLSDGEEAINFLCYGAYINGKKFAYGSRLIILDLHMPKKSGLEVLKVIKSKEETRHIPVIILAASEEAKEDCLKNGATRFITKPATPSEFMNAITGLKSFWLRGN